jgi:hypothetical protein
MIYDVILYLLEQSSLLHNSVSHGLGKAIMMEENAA